MTRTELANVALGHLGVSGLADIAEATVEAERIRLHWSIVRDNLLRQRPWNFATRRATLSALADAPAFDWDYAYQLPSDYLQAQAVNGKQAGTGEAEYEISDGQILTDDETCELKYTALVEEAGRWSATFCDAFTHLLAAAVAPALSTAPGLGDAMRQRAEEITVLAIGPENREARPRAVLAQSGSGWLKARMGITE